MVVVLEVFVVVARVFSVLILLVVVSVDLTCSTGITSTGAASTASATVGCSVCVVGGMIFFVSVLLLLSCWLVFPLDFSREAALICSTRSLARNAPSTEPFDPSLRLICIALATLFFSVGMIFTCT